MASALSAKLQLKPGMRLRVTNAPSGALEALAADLPGIVVAGDLAPSASAGPHGDAPVAGGEAGAGPAALLVFVANYDETVRLAAAALAAAPPDALVWVAYPKGASGVKTDVNRDVLWQALARTGWRPVRQVALDGVWSSMRFRPRSAVGK